MLVKTYGSAVQGVDAFRITIETNIGGGFGFALVGLPDNAVKESKERVFTAIKNNGYEVPRHKITINMAPADIRKEGAAYDLPIAIGILAASNQVNAEKASKYLIMGELSLDGTLSQIKGVLPMAIQARKEKFQGIIVPEQNAQEAAIVNNLDIIPTNSLKEAIDFLNDDIKIKPKVVDTRELFFDKHLEYELDFKDVKGQTKVKRAMEVAAAGGHNILMIGPPGAGKTMIAKRVPSILPPFTLQEALETTKIHSVAGKLSENSALMTNRPYRSPHHTISDVALVGGGTFPQPGEISLAHNGVLFLDELPEFKRTALEVLRQPLEERLVSISRARFSIEYPANFMLVGSMNPCPCGYYNHPEKECICNVASVHRYLNKISGPLLDRIDIQVEIIPVPFDDLTKETVEESSESIRKRVIKAREFQKTRFEDNPNIHSNAMMPTNLVREICKINKASQTLLKTAMNRLGLSARAYDRILKVARTIADLEESENIKVEHVAEAIQYRSLDRENWAG